MDGALVGTEFASYRIESVAGRGGMGVVYRAKDRALDRSVALKIIAPELTSRTGFRKRFMAESKVAASLDHPNVIPIYQAGEHDGTLFLAMRYVDGDDLDAVLTKEGRLEPQRAAGIIAQIASALDAAHECGLVHRDVKPANVLLTGKDHAYLTDFGLSKRLAAGVTRTRTGGLLGTLDYVAPEQIRGGDITPATDVYALGCLLFHVLTGRVPFPLDTEEAILWAHLSEPPPSVGGSTSVAAFDAIVGKAMSKRPEDRFASAGELAQAATAAARGGQEAAFKVAPRLKRRPRPAGRPKQDHQMALMVDGLTHPVNVLLLAGLLVVGVVLGVSPMMVPVSVAVYAVAVGRTYRDPRAQERVLARELDKHTRTRV